MRLILLSNASRIVYLESRWMVNSIGKHFFLWKLICVIKFVVRHRHYCVQLSQAGNHRAEITQARVIPFSAIHTPHLRRTQNGPSSSHKRAKSQKRERGERREQRERWRENSSARAIKRCREAQKWLRLSCSQADKSPSIKEMQTAVGCYGKDTPLFILFFSIRFWSPWWQRRSQKIFCSVIGWVTTTPNPHPNVFHGSQLHLVKRINQTRLFKKLITCCSSVTCEVDFWFCFHSSIDRCLLPLLSDFHSVINWPIINGICQRLLISWCVWTSH